ncbi:MAG: type II secretion system protein GspL [Deefgea sp.]
MSGQLEYLFYRIHGESTIVLADCLGFDAFGHCVAHVQGDEQSASLLRDLVIPAAWLTSHRLTLPAVNKKQRDLLISQALEDRVLGKLSDLHWVASPAVDGTTTVWLIEKKRLAAITQWVAQSGLSFQRWLPELLFLPHAFSYAQLREGIIFCSDKESGWLEDEADLLALYPTHSFKRISTTELTLPKQEAVSFYQPTKVSLSTNWNEWRIAIYIMIGCVFVYLLSLFIQWRSLASQESALRQEIRQTFASIFPGVPVVDPILQWQSQQKAVNSTGSTGDALDLLHKTAAQIDLEVGIHSVEVKAGKVNFVLDESKSGALLAKLTAQGAKVNSNKMPDGRISVEVQQ